MERHITFDTIVEKLATGEKFGLFDNGNKCYFRDGSRVHYTELWKAIRKVKGIEEGKQTGTLIETCGDWFEGIFSYKFSQHKWEKKKVSAHQ